MSEGWHRGPTVTPVDDPTLMGPLVEQLMAEARPNADMSGRDKNETQRKGLRETPCPSTLTSSAPRASPIEHSWTSKDSLLYALGVGCGAVDPFTDLQFTTENTKDTPQQVLPTMAVVLGFGGAGVIGAIGSFNPAMLVHGEQAIALTSPIPVQGTISTVGEIVGIYDKVKGAVIATESVSTDLATGKRAVPQPLGRVHPGRGRLGRRPGPRGGRSAARPRARPQRHLPDARPTRP